MNVRHLPDERLIDMCLAGGPGEREQQHLATCPACEERRVTLVRLLSDVSATAEAETDALFSDERLARQHARILQRVERAGRPARLINFPSSAPPALRVRPAPRWIAGAAAAGLILGLLAGQVVRLLPNGRVAPGTLSERPTMAVLQAVSPTMSEDEFLGRIELAVEGSTGASLQPLDDLTPRVWEVAAQ